MKRAGKREAAAMLADRCPDRMRELLAPAVDEFVRILLDDLRSTTLEVTDERGGVKLVNNPAHRTALELYPRIMRAIGASEDVLARILAAVNATSEAQLHTAMSLLNASQGATLADAERVAVDTLRRVLKAEPWKRARLREAVFGEREVGEEAAPSLNGAHTNGAAL